MRNNLRAAKVRHRRIAEQRQIATLNAIRDVQIMTADRDRIEGLIDGLVTELRIAEGVGFDRESHWKNLTRLRLMLAEADKALASRRRALGLDPDQPPPPVQCPEIDRHLNDVFGSDA